MKNDDIIEAEHEEQPMEITEAIPRPAPVALTEEAIVEMEKQLELRERFLKIVQKTVKPKFWRIFGESVYLEGAGGYQCGAVLGIKFDSGPPRKMRKENGHYMWIYEVIATLGGRSSPPCLGTCASDNKFFCRKPTANAPKALPVPPEEVDEANVMKKAYENGISRAVTALLGLRGLKREDLKSMGIEENKTGGTVDFKKGSRGGDTRSAGQRNKDTAEENKVREETRAAFKEIIAIEGDLVQMGLDSDEFWRNVTRWEVDGEVKREFTRDEAGEYVDKTLTRYGNAKAVFVWKNNAPAIAEEMKKEVESAK